jgi:Bacteriophage tail sheath protein
MPVQVSYPGVYIQEVSSGVHTITGVSTSIGAFFGRTAKGPIDKAVRCLSYSDFLREFGGPHPLSDLAQSVRQFFDNGGTDCYVIRLAKGAAAASVTLTNLASGGASKNVLTAVAKGAGTWAHDVKLEVDYNTPAPDDTFNLAVIHERDGTVFTREDFSNLSMNPFSPRFAPTFVTQSSKLIELKLHTDMLVGGTKATDAGAFINDKTKTPEGFSQSRRVFVGTSAGNLLTNIQTELNKLLKPAAGDPNGKFSISLNGGAFINIDLGLFDASAALSRDELVHPTNTHSFVKLINNQLHLTDPSLNVAGSWDEIVVGKVVVLRLTSASGDFTSVRIRRAPTNDFAGPMLLGGDQGGIEVARYSNMRPVFNGTVFTGGQTNVPEDFLSGTNSIGAFANLAQTEVAGITIAGSPAVNVNLVTAGTKNFEQAPSGFDGVREKLRIIAQAINSDPNVPWSAELWGYHLAFRKKAGAINDKAAVTTTTATTFGAGFIANTRQYNLGSAGTSAFQSAGTVGNDGSVPDVGTYSGDPIKHTGFYALDTVDLFNLLVLPGDREVDESTYSQIIGPASIYCNQHRAFLLIDGPDSWTDGSVPVADATAVNTLRALVVKDHSAIFYPKVQYSDAGLKKLIGPSGMIAGLMARTDSQRGVWKAPAGTEAALLGVLDLELNLTDMENGVLNKLGVNCLRKFPTGIVNWGARTLDGSDDIGSEWKYIPIRRLALFLEESLFRGTKWVVFEPNDEPLWASIRLNLNAFMLSLFRQGAFQGSTPDKAFYVKCDAETTTQNDRNLGIVNIEVGFAPLKPAEFVVIKIQQIAGDLT